ncbi:hypothetical protein Tco_1170622 [Tanacetum coccineum]
MPYDSPHIRVHLLGSDEDSMTLTELTVLCTTLSKKVETLESDLKQTKLTYGATYTMLIMKVKKLEHKVNSSKARRRGRHKHDFEEPKFEFISPEEDYIAEPNISTANVQVSTAGAKVSNASPEVKTAAESLVYIRRSAAKRKDKGKAIMKEAELHMGSHTLQQLKKLSFDEIKELFKTTMKRVNTFTLMESDDIVPKVVAESSKRDAEQELNQESSKRQKIGEGSEPAEESKDDLSQEQLQYLMIIVPEEGMHVKALQTKYLIIDWEVYTKDSRMF